MPTMTRACFRVLMIVCFAATPAISAPERLQMGDGSGWFFVNGAWSEEGDTIKPPAARADYYYAFHRGKVYSDLTAEFDFRITTNHADAGFILCAQDPSHFYLVHFPNGGQQYRAQHFWAALSLVDGSGYMRFLKLALVQRVPSNLGIWRKVRIQSAGDELRLFVDGYEAFTVRDKTLLQPGRIGLAGFTKFELRNLTVDGREAPERAFNEKATLPKVWFTPAPAPEYGWQHRPSLARTPKGTLLMLMNTTRRKQMVDPSEPGNLTLLLRSTDRGRTWSKPVRMEELAGFNLLTLKDGSLIALRTGPSPHESNREAANEMWRVESKDDGVTWSKAEKARWDGPFPADPKALGGTYTSS
jgi:hypothetical protein